MSSARVQSFGLLAAAAFALAACGGGGGGGGSTSVIPTANPGGGATPTTHASPSSAPSSKPSGKPTPTPTPEPTASATSAATYEPPDPQSMIRSTYGRIGLSQIFDYFPNDGNTMSAAQISADAGRYDTVWGSFDPQPWRSSNPQALVSAYYITEEDNEMISGHNLQWWQQNHPDWILYACTASGSPTQDYAYSPGDGFPDVPLDFHNSAVVQYQVQQSLIPYAQANGYNAIALDNVLFNDFMEGGNPELGQTVKAGEYACGHYTTGGSFVTDYQSPSDPRWTTDILNWVAQAYAAAHAAGLAVIVNHPIGTVGSSNEQALLDDTDVLVDEDGFSDYGNYVNQTSGSFLNVTYRYMEWVQSQGKGFIDIDRYTLVNEAEPTSDQIEYSIATYLLANEGNADAENTAGTGYGTEQYHQEYATPIGKPCSPMYGGPSYSSTSPQIYYRRFGGGMVVVNAGSSSAQSAALPANHTYTDIEGRAVTNPLAVNSNDAYVMTTTNGCT